MSDERASTPRDSLRDARYAPAPTSPNVIEQHDDELEPDVGTWRRAIVLRAGGRGRSTAGCRPRSDEFASN